MVLNCKTCKSKFKTSHSDRLFCSQACYGIAHVEQVSGEKSGRWNKNMPRCPACNTRLRGTYRKFCSNKCRFPPKVEKRCELCGNSFLRKRSESSMAKFCSKDCRYNADSKIMSVEGHNNWRGGLTIKHIRIRGVRSYKLWRMAVMKRDNWTCVFCGKRGGYLEADHIKRFSEFPKLRFEIDNGRTLCRPCHETTFRDEGVTTRGEALCEAQKYSLNSTVT